MHSLVHTNFTAIGESWRYGRLDGRRGVALERPTARRVATAGARDALSLRTIAKDMTVAVATIMSVGILMLALAYSYVDTKGIAAIFNTQELNINH